MKQFIIAIAALAALSSCAEKAIDLPVQEFEKGECALTINVAPEIDAQTKAPAAYTSSKDYESVVKTVQIFVFDDDGKLNAYVNAGTSTSSTINVSYGVKDIWAAVNAESLSDVTTKTELLSSEVLLGKNYADNTKGFVMTGNASVTLSGATASASITVSRLVSRIALVSITNDLPVAYGSIDVTNAFLANVVGNENVAGNASPTVWYNKEGRSDTTPRISTAIINGGSNLASEASLTYKSIGENVEMDGVLDVSSSPYLMYAYKNSSTTAPPGFHSTFTAQKTVLIVTAVLNSTTYYYPIVFDSLERNKTYTVALTLKGLGSEDPDAPVSKGAITANITVAGWSTGTVYDENI